MHLAKWIVQSLREKGLNRTFKIAYNVLADYSFDWTHGTETTRWVKVDEFKTPSDNKAHAVHYQASKARMVRTLLKQLELPTDGAFVDLGCGKGRVLLLASRHGFKRVVGVDFCTSLCLQARRNAALFRQRYPDSAPIEVIESDAAHYAYRGDEIIFYLYNPFNEIVLSRALERIGESVRKSPRAVWLIYNTPLHHGTIVRDGQFTVNLPIEIGGNDFRVYSQFSPAPVTSADRSVRIITLPPAAETNAPVRLD